MSIQQHINALQSNLRNRKLAAKQCIATSRHRLLRTFIQIKPEELAKNLNEAGGFVPGVRPGKDTENHISKILVRLTFVGGFFIAILAAIPIVFSMIGGLESAAAIGGTSLLIVVGVALETYKQLEGSLLSRNYKKGYSRR